MTYFKRLTVIMLVVAMILGTAGIAGATPVDVVGSNCEEAINYLMDLGIVAGYPDGTYQPYRTLTRAEMAKIIVLAKLGAQGEQMAGYLKGAYSFSDVPATHWASGYVMLAKNLGIVNGYPGGTYMPEGAVTYAELLKMLVEAAGLNPAAGVWPTNYLTAATAAGITGAIAGGWTANAPVTRGDMACLTAFTVHEVANPATGKTLGQTVHGESAIASLLLTPAVSNVGIGEAVTFTAAAADADGNAVTVTAAYATSNTLKSAVSPAGIFVASAGGTYTVTATADGKTATATINVYGAAKALSITPATAQIPANGESTVVITVAVVDANGFVVANDNSTDVTIDYDEDGDNDAVNLPSTTSKTVVNGKATFKLTATETSDRTDIIKATDDDDELTAATCEISSVEQIAGSIKLSVSPAAVSANRQTMTTVTAEVLDQSGGSMIYGVYNLNFSISGPGTWDDDGDKANKTIATDAEGIITQDVYSIQGSEGTIVVTVSGEGLATATISIASVVAGAPAGIKVEVLDGSIKSGADWDDDAIEFRVVLVDSQGRPTVYEDDIYFNVTLDDGNEALSTEDFVLDGDALIPAFSTASAVIRINEEGAGAGSYVIRVRDTLLKYAKATFTASVTAGAADHIGISLPPSVATGLKTHDATLNNVYMLVGSASGSVTVRMYDAAGNTVPEAGVQVTCQLDDGGQTGNAYINGTKMTAGVTSVKVKTDSTGTAVFNVTSNGYVGDSFTFVFTTEDYGTATSRPFVIADRVANSVEITLRDNDTVGSTTGSMTSLAAGDTGYLHIRVKDQNGQTLMGTSHFVRVSFNNEAENIDLDDVYAVEGYALTPSLTYYRVDAATDATSGWLILAVTGTKTGTFTVTGQDRQSSPLVSGTRSLRTVAGKEWAGFGVQLTSGDDFENVEIAKNTPYAFRVFMTDAGGNAIPVTTTMAADYQLGTWTPSGDGWYLLVEGQYWSTSSEEWIDFGAGDEDLWEVRTTSAGTSVDPISFSSGTVYKTVYIVFSVKVQNVSVQAIEGGI
jgi:hypothetical protein